MSCAGMNSNVNSPPSMNIVIQVVGSRGDVQPFIALGNILHIRYGHRVRVATHAVFKTFVEDNGLEFFNIGGNPSHLMDYMVKNPGIIPSKKSLMEGDVGKRRKEIGEILVGCWRSCIEAGNGMDEFNQHMEDYQHWQPFIAQAIIANPVSFGHIHCAEKLGVRLHFMFTMPWTPTRAFPHPLARNLPESMEPSKANLYTYLMISSLTFQGLGDVINRFRIDRLGLDPVSALWFPMSTVNATIPFTYCWSPALIPKPPDWSTNVEVAGFYFLSQNNAFKPDSDLHEFLQSGPAPVYIGFGSIVVDDPAGLTRLITEAVNKAGVRALMSKGWGGLGGDTSPDSRNIFLLGDVPHDWLFEHVSAVCHHGGAGTTAAGIAAGKPTIIIPFFGDQKFWGSMVYRSGAGPPPIPHKELTVDKLEAAFRFCAEITTQAAAQRMKANIQNEDGAAAGIRHFHHCLPVDTMRCAIDSTSVAVWTVRSKGKTFRLGSKAVGLLIQQGLLKQSNLRLNRFQEYDMSSQPSDPITALLSFALTALKRTTGDTITLSTAFASMANPHGHNSDTRDYSQIPLIDFPEASRPIDIRDHEETSAHAVQSRRKDGWADTTRKAAKRDINHIIDLPRELILSTTKGFHNAPKLWHDETVRQPVKVTGIKSGLKAATLEFTLGFYDGVSGIITHPYQGAKSSGKTGFLIGCGKGFGGLVCKPAAGVLGLVSYTWDGLYRQSRTYHNMPQFTLAPEGQVIRGDGSIFRRIATTWLIEGEQAATTMKEEERMHFVERWKNLNEVSSRSIFHLHRA